MVWKNIKKAVKETDILLLLICLALSVFGIIMVFSATYDGESLLSRDGKVMILATVMGIAAALVISFIDYDIILKLWPVVGAASVILMLGLFVFGVSPDGRSDAFSWYRHGGSRRGGRRSDLGLRGSGSGGGIAGLRGGSRLCGGRGVTGLRRRRGGGVRRGGRGGFARTLVGGGAATRDSQQRKA